MHSERHHLPVARSFRALGRPHSFHSHRITCSQKGTICPLLGLLAHSALLGDTTCAESHMQTGAICTSLALLAHSVLSGDPTHFTCTISHAHRRAPSAHRSRCSLIQRFLETLLACRQAPSAHRSCCSLILRAPPGDRFGYRLVATTYRYPDHPPKYQPKLAHK